MAALYFPRNWRQHKLLLIMMAVELPFTVVVLTLTGIASHDLYQTRLWQDGADNGFNSAPDEAVYAAANYRPYKAPMVWSSFLTKYNLVLGVLSTFFLITKAPVHFLRIFYPPFSVFVHIGLTVLYIVSARFQGGSDMSDPKHPQPGAPWYITKSCSSAAHRDNIGYCNQAKALFAIIIIMIVIYVVEVGISVHSCFLTPEEKEERREQREEKKIMKEYEETILKSPSMIPLTPAPATGTYPSTTPRTLAFNRLDSKSPNLPLRDYNQRIEEQAQRLDDRLSGINGPSQTYFPPPPKAARR